MPLDPNELNEVINRLSPKISEHILTALVKQYGPQIQQFLQAQTNPGAGANANGPVVVERFNPETGQHEEHPTTRPQLIAEQIDTMLELTAALDELNDTLKSRRKGSKSRRG